MPVIKETSAAKHACPFNNFAPCMGAGCMAWIWHGRRFEEVETTNLVETPEGARPSGDPVRPPGEGWKRYGAEFSRGYENSAKMKLPKATGQKWRRSCPQTGGFCGRLETGQYGFDHEFIDDDELPF